MNDYGFVTTWCLGSPIDPVFAARAARRGGRNGVNG